MLRSAPDLLNVRREASALRVRARVPDDLDCFEGHFPGRPIVPAFVQLDWVLTLAREQLALAAPPAALEALKFRSPLLPGREFELRIEIGGPAQIRFELGDAEQPISSGRVRFDAGLAQHEPVLPAPAPPAPKGPPLRLAHAGRMRLLERVLAHDARVTLCEAGIAETTPLQVAGRAPAWLALELLAQGMAAHGGLEESAGAGERRALLVGSRRVELRTRGFEAGTRIWVRAEHAGGSLGLVAFECALGTGAPPRHAEDARSRALAVGSLAAYVGSARS